MKDKVLILNPGSTSTKIAVYCNDSDRIATTASIGWIRNNVEYAYIDPMLWDMLQQKAYRNRLAEFIVEEKIKTATARSRSILKVFLNWLVAI